MSRPVKIMVIIVGSTLALFLGVLLLAPRSTLFNERWQRTSRITFHDGSQATVSEDHSDSRYIVILPHSYGVSLGTDQRDVYAWEHGGLTYIRETFFIPIVIDSVDGRAYVAEFDRETDFSKVVFRLYVYEDGSWRETDRAEFPREISLQNRWLSAEDAELLKSMDASDYWFRKSLTGSLWVLLETGEQYYESDKKDYPESFYAEYIDKYLRK